MVNLTKGQASELIIMTLYEKQTLTENYEFRFVFVHTLTRQTVTFDKGPDDDQSTYPQRYNQFEIDTQSVFGTKPAGEWLYTVYEVDTETDEITATLEVGKMILKQSTDFDYEKYTTATSYTAYQRS